MKAASYLHGTCRCTCTCVPHTVCELRQTGTHARTHIYIYEYLFADERRVRLEQLHRAPRGGVVPPRRVHEDAAHLVRVRARARVRVKVKVGIKVSGQGQG